MSYKTNLSQWFIDNATRSAKQKREDFNKEFNIIKEKNMIKKMFNKIPESLIKRMKGFLWHSGMMLIAGGIDILIETLSDWNFPTSATLILGLILGQVSKYLNSKK